MAEDASNATRAGRRSVASAFWPLYVWAACSLLLLGWQWNERELARTILTFRVTVDGASSFPEQVTADLDGRPIYPGRNVGLGRSRLVLTGQNLEPFATNFFAWYGKNDLGVLPLVRSKGTLEIHCDPAPQEIKVDGQLFQTKRQGAPVLSAHVPVGSYRVTATFAHSWDREDATVGRNQTTRVDIAPAFGALDLASDPKGVQFTLVCLSMANLSLTGTTPVQFSELATGQYDLSLQWNGASKEKHLEISNGETNHQKVAFAYGTVELATTPSGASVSSGFSDLGKTPRTLLLRPGEYQFHLDLKGYRSAEVAVSVADKQTVSISTNLVNAGYADAMDAARNALSAGRYDEALDQVNAALGIKPDDPQAQGLKTRITGAIADREAKARAARQAAAAQAAEQARQAEAAREQAAQEARKRAEDTIFEQAAAQLPDAGLFPRYVWTITNGVDRARAAVSALFREKDAPWKLVRQSNPGGKSWLFFGEGHSGLLGTHKKKCVVMVTEMSPGRAFLYAEFWEYTLGNKIGLSLFGGVSADSYVPVAPGRYEPGVPGAAAAYMKAVAEDFRRRLVKELQ